MSTLFVTPRLQRTLSAVYRFYDAFYSPLDEDSPPVTSLLTVSIPNLSWTALGAENDSTYRFSAGTLTHPAPTGINLAVQVIAVKGDYVNLEPISLTLPLPLSVPPQRSDFLIPKLLWPTVGFRPPDYETAVRGQILSASAQPVAGLKVEIWPAATAVPPLGTPYTQSNANGDFLYRFPLLKGAGGSSAPFRIRLNGGLIPVVPASLPITLGRAQIIQFQRT